MHTTRKILPFVLTCLPLAALACNKSGAEAQREINEAREEAVTETTGARVEADKKIAEVQTDFAKTREDFRHDYNQRLADLDGRIAKLDAKALKATGRDKVELDTRLPDVHARRDAFARSFGALEHETAATWDGSKNRIEKEWNALKDAVDKVD